MIIDKLLFEKSVPGRRAVTFGEEAAAEALGDLAIPERFLRAEPPALPELSEPDVVRHFVGLSRKNHGVDSGSYPLGSCTMKYNPKINEDLAAWPAFAAAHPLQSPETVQGNLALMFDLQQQLCAITGMDAFCLQPAAGAHGELTGLMMLKAYHEARDEERRQIIVPDSAHGTNPASASMAGFEVVEVKSDAEGNVDLAELRRLVGPQTAGLMLTNPNTLGLFESHIEEIAEIVHAAGGLLYYDGANMNAIMGIACPGDMGFDVVHLNLHKTFATPHGGGGPGSGPVGVKAALEPFLPLPVIVRQDGRFQLSEDRPSSIGRVKSFYGNFGVLVKAYAYILSMGAEGLREATEVAVLNANYLRVLLSETLDVPYDRLCMHEFVASAARYRDEYQISAMDMAKKMIDYGIHPPTVYFPLIVKEAMMFEPTESESKENLEAIAAIVAEIATLAKEDPEALHAAPAHTLVGRLNETAAARSLVLSYQEEG